MSDKLTSKQKIDELLGISSGESIDDFLDEISHDAAEVSSTMENIDENVKANLDKVEKTFIDIQTGKTTLENSPEVLIGINSSMKEVEELIDLSKQLFKHIYQNVVSSDLIDSELIGSAAKMLESIHINIAEFISLYRDKQKFVEKIKVMVFQQEQKKELMLLKHKLDMEKIKAKGTDDDVIDVENIASYSQEAIIKALSNKDDAEITQ